MKKLLAVLIICAMLLSLLASCENNKPSNDTTVAQTEPEKEPEVRKSKPYPNAMKVSDYNLLTDSEKALYEGIAKLLSSPQASKSVALKRNVNTSCFDMIMDIFRANFATHDAVLENISYTEADGKITAVMISDDFDAQAFKIEYEAVSKKADEIIKSIPMGLSTTEILFEVIDYITANTEHISAMEKTNAYTALIDGKANSEGFAKALDLLLKKLDIPSFTVYGFEQQNSYNKDPDTDKYILKVPDPKIYWNYVRLWNKWYKIDITKLYPVWQENGELFLDLDVIMNDPFDNLAPYYFYRNDVDKMQIPLLDQWKNRINSYEFSDDAMERIMGLDLGAIANDIKNTLQFNFQTLEEADKFLENNRKTIKDKTGTDYTLHLRKDTGELTIIDVTPVKVVDFDSLSYTTEQNVFYHCYDYDNLVLTSIYDMLPIENFEQVSINLDIPEHWIGHNGIYEKFFSKSNYPGYTSAMNIICLVKVSEGFVLDKNACSRINNGVPYMSEYRSGTTSNGNNYAYFLQIEPIGIEGYYNFFVQISDEYVAHFYIIEELEKEDIVMKVIDSISICE